LLDDLRARRAAVAPVQRGGAGATPGGVGGDDTRHARDSLAATDAEGNARRKEAPGMECPRLVDALLTVSEDEIERGMVAVLAAHNKVSGDSRGVGIPLPLTGRRQHCAPDVRRHGDPQMARAGRHADRPLVPRVNSSALTLLVPSLSPLPGQIIEGAAGTAVGAYLKHGAKLFAGCTTVVV
jgi:hypothetical protein